MIDVKEERTRLAITQKRLAHMAGIDARTVRKLERGETVSLETRHAVYTALGLPLERSEGILPSSIFDTPDARLLSARLMAGASICYAAVVIGLSEVSSRYPDITAGWPISFMVLACLIGTVIHFVLATRDLRTYYSMKYSPKAATRNMLKTVFPFGVAILMPGFFWPGPHGMVSVLTSIVGNLAFFMALMPALQEWIDQIGETATHTDGR